VEKDGNFPKREEVNVAASMKITDYWSISGSSHWDLAENLALKHSAGLRYVDECLLFELVGTRSFFKDEDVEPSDSLLFRIKFKYLGEAGGRSE
jgi:lipopolysaccharide assembly outer membrane protein LptD (OstA)